MRDLCAPRSLARCGPLIPQRFRRDRPVVPVVRLTGIIGFSTPLRPGLSLAGIARTLDRAFAMRRAAAVALAINSPGGSPVQSHLIFRRIRELAAEHKRPVSRLHRRRRRVRRLHDRLRRRRDHRRSAFDRRLDRRRRRFVRLRQADRENRRRAPALYVGRAQGDARSVPAGKSRRRRTPEEIAARHPRRLHRARQIAARRQAYRSGK